MQYIEIPTICPICSQPVSRQKKYETEILMCTNEHCANKLEGR